MGTHLPPTTFSFVARCLFVPLLASFKAFITDVLSSPLLALAHDHHCLGCHCLPCQVTYCSIISQLPPPRPLVLLRVGSVEEKARQHPTRHPLKPSACEACARADVHAGFFVLWNQRVARRTHRPRGSVPHPGITFATRRQRLACPSQLPLIINRYRFRSSATFALFGVNIKGDVKASFKEHDGRDVTDCTGVVWWKWHDVICFSCLVVWLRTSPLPLPPPPLHVLFGFGHIISYHIISYNIYHIIWYVCLPFVLLTLSYPRPSIIRARGPTQHLIDWRTRRRRFDGVSGGRMHTS